MTRLPDLLLIRARILTMDPSLPVAEALLCAASRIVAVGPEAEVLARSRELGGRPRDLEARGMTVVPAFIDPHIHLLATAARRLSVDCSPEAADSIAAMQARIAARAAVTVPGQWVRAAGYDELALAERRHPTRHDLDEAAPQNPVRLLHRGGHACVLNTMALKLAGIDISTPEPPGGFLDRELETGEPSGLLIEMDALVEAVMPPLDYQELAEAVREVSAELLAAGVTFVQDASASNDTSTWHLFERLQREGNLPLGVSMLLGTDMASEAWPNATTATMLRPGGFKLQPRELEHELSPSPEELGAILAGLDGHGRQIAVHAVGRAAVEATLAGLAALGGARVSERRHRVEHGGICSQATAELAARLGAVFVTQPGFLYWNGDLIRARIAEADLPDLYPWRRLLDAGVIVAGSSDSPVAPSDPVRAMRTAVERRTRTGRVLNPEQGATAVEALAMFTRNAAFALHLEGERGALRPGMAADFVVLSEDTTAPDCDWNSLRVLQTIRAGEVMSSA